MCARQVYGNQGKERENSVGAHQIEWGAMQMYGGFCRSYWDSVISDRYLQVQTINEQIKML